MQKIAGSERANTEILDTRPRSESYSSFCIFDSIMKITKYPTVWFTDNGFTKLETSVDENNPILSLVPTSIWQMIPNNIELKDYLKLSLLDETMIQTIMEQYNDKNMDPILYEYMLLYNNKLEDPYQLDPKYRNVDIICLRGYIQLLVLKCIKEFIPDYYDDIGSTSRSLSSGTSTSEKIKIMMNISPTDTDIGTPYENIKSVIDHFIQHITSSEEKTNDSYLLSTYLQNILKLSHPPNTTNANLT